MSKNNKTLVLGGSGFLGSHIVKALIAEGREVRVLTRRSSNMEALAGLEFEHVYGDVLQPDSLSTAMQGCAVVYHCIVDTRAWIRDPAPLFAVNVEGLRHTLDAALDAEIEKFVFTSSYVAIGHNASGVATEADVVDVSGSVAKGAFSAKILRRWSGAETETGGKGDCRA